MAKLLAVLISSLRLFQSRLPLNFNEFVPNLCDLAGGSLQSILILKSYSTTFLVKRSHKYGGFKWLSVLCTFTISFCRFFCELSKFHPFARVRQASLRYHYYKYLSVLLLPVPILTVGLSVPVWGRSRTDPLSCAQGLKCIYFPSPRLALLI